MSELMRMARIKIAGMYVAAFDFRNCIFNSFGEGTINTTYACLKSRIIIKTREASRCARSPYAVTCLCSHHSSRWVDGNQLALCALALGLQPSLKPFFNFLYTVLR